MKREELLKRTKKELLTLAGERGARLSAKLRKSELVDQILALISPKTSRKSTETPPRARKKASKRSRVLAGARKAKTAATALRPRRRASKSLTAEELHQISEEISRLFPPPLENTEIVLYEIDPFHAHTFWHVRYDEMEAARRSLGQEGEHAALLLRFYDVTLIDFDGFNAHYSFDVAVHSLRSNYYVDFWESGRAYIVDIGLRTHDGRFVTLARSNHVELPPHAPSDNFDRTGIVVDSKIHVICEVADVARAETIEDIRPEPRPEMEAETSDQLVRTFYRQLTGQGVAPATRRPRARESTAEAPPSTEPAEALPGYEGGGATVPSPDSPQTYPRVRAGHRLAPPTPPQGSGISIAYLQGALTGEGEAGRAAETGRGVSTSSYSFYISEHRPQGVSSWVASASGVSSWVTSPGAGAGATQRLQEVIALPPEEFREAGRLKDFYAELIIQGRVQPGEQLRFLGQPVSVRPDGTFHIRRRLGEGTLIVPLPGGAPQVGDPPDEGALK